MTFAQFDRKARDIAARTGSGRAYHATAPLERRPRRHRPGHRPGERPGGRLVVVSLAVAAVAVAGMVWSLLRTGDLRAPVVPKPAVTPPATPAGPLAPAPAAPGGGLVEALPEMPPGDPSLAGAIPPGTGQAELLERVELAQAEIDAVVFAVALSRPRPAGRPGRSWQWPRWLDHAAVADVTAELRACARALGPDHPVADAARAYAALVDEHLPALHATVAAWNGDQPSIDATTAGVARVIGELAGPSVRLRTALAATGLAPSPDSGAGVVHGCATPAAALLVQTWQPDDALVAEQGGTPPARPPVAPSPPSAAELRAAGLACLDASRALLAVEPDRAPRQQLSIARWGNRVGFHLVELGMGRSVALTNLAQVVTYLVRDHRRALRARSAPPRGGRRPRVTP